MTVFISKDIHFDVQQLPITINKYGSVYIPEDTYMTSEPMPEAWMETFGKKHNPLPAVEDILESSEELEEAYDPSISKDQMISQPLVMSTVLHTNYDLRPEAKNKHKEKFRKIQI